jgi:Homeodomain-like domain
VERHLTIREIAAAVDRSESTIRYWLRRYELTTTEHARFKRRRYPRVAGRCRHHGETSFIKRPDGALICLRCRADAVSAWRRRAKETLVREAGGRCRLCG